MDRKTLKLSKECMATRSGEQPEKTPEFITFRKLCNYLGQPEYKVRYQIGALNIKHEYKVGAARVFSSESLERLRAAFSATENKKSNVAV